MAKQADMKMVIELSEYDRVLIQQLIDRLANPVPPVLPYPNGLPAPQWWQTPTVTNAYKVTSDGK